MTQRTQVKRLSNRKEQLAVSTRRAWTAALAAAVSLVFALPATASAASPPPPTNVHAANVTGSSILLSWSAAPGATSYGVYLGGYRSHTTGTSFNFTQLSPCTTYTLGVRSRNASGVSSWVSITVTTAQCATTAPPPAPSNVATSNITNSSVLLSWSAAPGASSYDVYLGGYQTQTTGTSYNFTQLAACTTYTLGVRSRNTSGTSAWDSVTVQTSGCTSTPPPSPPANSSPPTIAGSAEQGQTLTASPGSWTNSPSSYAYQWQRCTSSSGCGDIGGATGQSYTAQSADVGDTLDVVVTASNAGGSASATSAPTQAVTAAPPPPPASGLHVSGTQLLDANGNVVHLHGVDRAGTEYACIQGWGIFDGPNATNDDSQVPLMKNWHANSAFIGLNEDCWLGINGVPSAYGGQSYINAIVHETKTLEANGMYPVIGLFWSAPGSSQATGQAAMPDNDHSPAFWQAVANTFKNDPNVIFRLKEEPYPAGNTDSVSAWQCWSAGDVQYGASGSLTPTSQTSHCSEGYKTVGMQSLINIIRGTGATNVIQVPGVQYANSMTHFLDSGIRVSDTLATPQLMGDVDVYPNGNSCGSVTCYDSEYAPVAAAMPFDFGEFGESVDGGDCSTTGVDAIMSWADSHSAGYYGWDWDTWGGCLQLITDYTTGNPNGNWGNDYKNHLATLS
jgi:hypothetical protein